MSHRFPGGCWPGPSGVLGVPEEGMPYLQGGGFAERDTELLTARQRRSPSTLPPPRLFSLPQLINFN